MKFLLTGTAAALALTAPAHAATSGFALNADGTEILVIEDITDPATTTTLGLSVGLDAITYRPRTQQLLGYAVDVDGAADKIFTIDTATGAVTDTGASFGTDVDIAGGSDVDFDFNTSLDAVRVISTDDDNLVFFPADTASGNANAGGVIRATDLFFDSGDVNEGSDPEIFANAYTNAVDGEVSPTTAQFALDAATNTLVTLANNAGTLGTVGAVTVGGVVLDFSSVGAMDIVSEAQGDNTAIALLNLEGAAGAAGSALYEIDLGTGAASLISGLDGGTYAGFAAQVSPAAIPVPAAGLMLMAGLGGLGALRLRRKR